MSVLGSVAPRLTNFISHRLGEERYHELAAEFLGVSYNVEDPHFDTVDEVAHHEPLFTSWLWHDYHEPGSNQPLITTFAETANNITNEERTLLEQMSRSQVLGVFKVGDFRPGNIGLEDIRTGVQYRVREYKLASQIQSGQLLFLRIAQQADHWEIITPDTAQTPTTIDDQALLDKLADELPERMTIKDTPMYMWLLQELGITTPQEPEQQPIPLSQARQQLADAMHESGLDAYTSPEQIEQRMRAELAAKEEPLAPPAAIRSLLSLLNSDRGVASLMQTMNAATALWNALGPDKAVQKMRRKQRVPDIHASQFNPYEWLEKADRSHAALTSGNPADATKLYDELFAELLLSRSTPASLYRLLTNAAIAHLANGNLLLGEHLVEEALRLCPSYDFAQKQRVLIDEGAYLSARIEQVAQRLEDISLPLLSRDLRNHTDTQIQDDVRHLGIDFKQTALAKQLAKRKSADEALARTWHISTDDERYDQAYALLSAARERWAPQVVWPDTLHDYAGDLDESIYPVLDDGTEGDPDWPQAIASSQRLHEALRQASGKTIRAWMHDSADYTGYRQNFVYYTEEARRVRQTKAYRSLTALCELALQRTSDVIYTVPDILAQARTSSAPTVKQQINVLAKANPYDHAALQILGDSLPSKQKGAALYAFQKALAALDKRIKNDLLTNPPYDIEPIAEHYEYLAGQLASKNGDKATNRQLGQRLEEVFSDTRLTQSVAAPTPQDTKTMLQNMEPDNPVLNYLEWFDTLGIDLSSGDGNETRLTAASNSKIGRNAPCPCGSNKKYKKCHGQP